MKAEAQLDKAVAALKAESQLRQLKAAHYDEAVRSHHKTRELLAHFFGVGVDSEEYDSAYDSALAEIRDEGPNDE